VLKFPITDSEWHIVLQAKSSFLYSYGDPWSKKTSPNLFDITMGSYDGAESCELAGAYLLHKIREKFGSICDFGLYRDDGLGIFQVTLNFDSLSLKCQMCLLNSVMRWKAHSYLSTDANGKQKKTFGFNSRHTPPQVSAMLNFEKGYLV